MTRPAASPAALTDQRATGARRFIGRATLPLRAVSRAAVFFLKVFPMLPSRPVDWVTQTPVIDRVRYPTCSGYAEGEVYRPPASGPHPGIVVCLGVVPFGVDHPQVPVLGNALARAGFTALLYWSPAMRDFRLDPVDVENIALAYQWLIEQPGVDASRSGLLGTCVGGSFALMASADARIRDRVGFLAAYAPFSSMQTFAHDIASATRSTPGGREPWKVDQLTRHVFVQSVTAELEPGEAERIRNQFYGDGAPVNERELSADGQAIYALLTAQDEPQADAALERLPVSMQQRLAVLSPMNYLKDIQSPLTILLHDRGDLLIPVSESRRLVAALDGRAGVNYTEMQFSHLDPTKGKLPLPRLVREFAKFFRAVYPLFRQTTAV
jgi:hypothetical protein